MKQTPLTRHHSLAEITQRKNRERIERGEEPRGLGRNGTNGTGKERKARAHPQRRHRPISPASKAQREFVKDKCCLGCGREASEWLAIDPAHIWPRGRGGCDSRFCVVPLCRAGDGSGCHREQEEGRLDLLSILVADYGRWLHHIQHALRHGEPVPVLEKLAGARISWGES